jgi:hypothetical protein
MSGMGIDPGRVDMGSSGALRDAFRSAPEPALEDLAGTHRGEYVGPRWLRTAGPVVMRLGRMPGWYGKRFTPADDGTTLVGVNLLRSGEEVIDSVPMVAAVGPSRVDGRPALIIGYPVDAPFPWPRVTDELRPLGEAALIGVTFGIPGSLPGGTPFLLRRIE